jgi:SAM-dependent methyltransferase
VTVAAGHHRSAAVKEDVAFYASLAREATEVGGAIVELAVGNGRVAIPAAEATRREIIGIDPSPGMLRQARADADVAGVDPKLIRADVRDVQVDAPALHSMHHDVPDNRVDLVLGGGGTSSFWWAAKKAWLGLIDVAGLALEALSGGFDGEPLTPESRKYVCVVRR